MVGSLNMLHLNNEDSDYGIIDEIKYSTEFDETLLAADEGLVVISAKNKPICNLRLALNDKMISATRLISGWEVLIKNKRGLVIVQLDIKESKEIALKSITLNVSSATWSPCGNYLALGDKDSPKVAIYDKRKNICREKSLNLTDEREFINPVSLKVIAWSSCGKKVITVIDYISALTMIIWAFEKGEIHQIN